MHDHRKEAAAKQRRANQDLEPSFYMLGVLYTAHPSTPLKEAAKITPTPPSSDLRAARRRSAGAQRSVGAHSLFTSMVRSVVVTALLASHAAAGLSLRLRPAMSKSRPAQRITGPQMQAGGLKGYFADRDVLLVERNQEDIAAFHAKERTRWREVYDEEYKEAPQEFYPGDRVKVVSDVPVKRRGEVVLESARGIQAVVTHYEFDDGYESCQTCSTSLPVTVLFDEEVG
jgi:hypothetical protein